MIARQVASHRPAGRPLIAGLTLVTAVLVLLTPKAGLAQLDREDLKALSVPMYFPGAGIQFSKTVADDVAYLNPSMLRMEFIGEQDAERTINYLAYDYIIDSAGERGIPILGLVDYQSVAWSSTSDWATDDFRERFVERLEELVEHYHDRPHPIRHWEVWNEPDLADPNFNVRIDPLPYSRILIESYEAIKAIDPEAVVVFGGLSPKGFMYAEDYLGDVYSTQPMQDYYTTNGHYPFDVVAVHPYPEIYSAPNPALANILNQRIKAVMNAHGDRHKKVWLTEMGWSTYWTSEANQALYLTQSYELMETLVDPAFPDDPPYVEKYFWFYYVDFTNVDRWGLYTQGRRRKKPSYDAFLALTTPGPEPIDDPLDPGQDPPVWNATSDSVLPVQVSSDDLLQGKIGVVEFGGFHEASAGGVERLTNGQFDSTGTSVVLADYSHPALRIRYNFDPPVDLREVRTFAGHFGDSGNRAFQSNDIYINGELAAFDLRTGNYGQVPPGNSGVSVVRWLPDEEEEFVATQVYSLTIAFWCTSALDLDFRDRWSPEIEPDMDTDGLGAAYVAPVIKEIDAFGEVSTALAEHWLLY